MKSIYFFYVILFIGMSFITCRSPNDPTPLRAPYLHTPVSRGIIITGETGPDPLAAFGKPDTRGRGNLNCKNNIPPTNTGRQIPDELRLATPYPNPFNGEIRINFDLPCSAYISIYVVPAKFFDSHGEFVPFANALVNLPGGLAADVILEGELDAGSYVRNWRGFELTGDLLPDGSNFEDVAEYYPDGFYRVYLKAGNELLWQDILLLREICNAPSGFPQLGEGSCR